MGPFTGPTKGLLLVPRLPRNFREAVLVGQPANNLQRGRKGERMKEEEETTEEKASDGKTSERGFAVVHRARRTGTTASGEGHERTG
jgi:hypothetical protein